MPTKAEMYAQMAEKVAVRQLAGVGGLSHHRRPALQVSLP